MANYDAEMQKIAAAHAGARLLLHVCCAPCASYCLEETAHSFRVTALFYNPNLDGEEEFLHRKGELVRYLEATRLAGLLECPYSPEEFAVASHGLEDEPEGGRRCHACFRLRLMRTAQEAKRGGYDFFATTLTLSPLKNAAKINEIGFVVAAETGVEYLPTDFKKRGGYLRSIALSKQYGLYRQNYCGCVFSKR